MGDAKYVKELTMAHVKQVRGYKGYPFFAKKGVIVVTRTTEVPQKVREAAKSSSIKIVRNGIKRREKSLLEKLFGV